MRSADEEKQKFLGLTFLIGGMGTVALSVACIRTEVELALDLFLFGAALTLLGLAVRRGWLDVS